MKKLWNKLVGFYDLISSEIYLFYIVNRYWKEDNKNERN